MAEWMTYMDGWINAHYRIRDGYLRTAIDSPFITKKSK